jgi:hypothetical protein
MSTAYRFGAAGSDEALLTCTLPVPVPFSGPERNFSMYA